MLSQTPNMSYRIQGEQLDIADILAKTPETRLEVKPRSELVVVMAGGLGQRMLPLTDRMPKPLLPIQGRPMLEHIMCQMIRQGFGRFKFSVRHMSDQIKAHFGNGSRWNIEIDYIDEPDALGTAGGLSLLDPAPVEPIIVANADLITDLNYGRVLDRHRASGADITMCTREAVFQVPYGVIKQVGERVITVEEKPTQSVVISAGMYALSPKAIANIGHGEHIDMPDLIQRCIDHGQNVTSLAIDDRWVDVGRRQTYQALLDYLENGPETDDE